MWFNFWVFVLLKIIFLSTRFRICFERWLFVYGEKVCFWNLNLPIMDQNCITIALLHIFLVNIFRKIIISCNIGKELYWTGLHLFIYCIQNKNKNVTAILETRHQETLHPQRWRRRCRFLCPLTLPSPPLPPGLDMQVLGVKGRDWFLSWWEYIHLMENSKMHWSQGF